ncbi:MAG: biosynthetic-type acetolactate synthase large subunit [Candidatus Nezhaarchaeales archaeon]
MIMSGAKALIEALRRENVNVIFGIPGGALLPVYDALYDSGIRHILVRHEQCAAHMADGYARASGRVGLCMATSGPGATNLVTGVANAYMDSTPLVAITGQVPRAVMGKDAFQEVDAVGIMTPITKYTFQPTSAAEIPYVVKAAFTIARSGRPGPVLIDVPRDVQAEEVDVSFPEEVDVRWSKPPADRSPHPLQVKRAVELLVKAEKPLIVAGGGVIISGAYDELKALAELLLAPVVTTLMGKGVMPEDHPLALGMIGMHGRGEANTAVSEADVILAVGTRFSDRSTGRLDMFATQARLIHVDVDTAEIGKNVEVDVPIVAGAKQALEAIYNELLKLGVKRSSTPWMERVKELKERLKHYYEQNEAGDGLKPSRLVKILRRVLPREAILTTGVGQNQMWAAINFQVYLPRTFITSGGLGTMGFGFPAALGVKVARPDSVVVDFDGDGSFLMTEQDLATSVTENIPVTVIVVNNGSLGMVRQWQDLLYGKRFMAVDLKRVPDFVKLAQAYGAEGVRVNSYDEFEEEVKKAIKSPVTTVIDVPVKPEEKVFPFAPPGKSLSEIMWRSWG